MILEFLVDIVSRLSSVKTSWNGRALKAKTNVGIHVNVVEFRNSLLQQKVAKKFTQF